MIEEWKIRSFLEWKKVCDERKYITTETVYMLLEHRLDYQLQIEKLN